MKNEKTTNGSLNTTESSSADDLYRNVDYNLIRSALQDLYHLNYADIHEDTFDACKRVIERKIQEATGMSLGRLLKEDNIKPLFRKDYIRSSHIYSNV